MVGGEGERHGVASQPTKVSFRTNKNRWITDTVDDASYRTDRRGLCPELRPSNRALSPRPLPSLSQGELSRWKNGGPVPAVISSPHKLVKISLVICTGMMLGAYLAKLGNALLLCIPDWAFDEDVKDYDDDV
uniref:Essential MCU regulator, mitochondrial n=1 Tax=Timema bartmani TaxID=61472 RepID=A0A7R9I5M8_9NEOP|nr:unnamed protein product [Timema bartmani]